MEEKNIREHFLEDFCEEIEDSNKYLDLSEEAEEAGMHGTAIALQMIAHEEMTHARFLRNELEHMHALPIEKHEKWEKLLKRFHK